MSQRRTDQKAQPEAQSRTAARRTDQEARPKAQSRSTTQGSLSLTFTKAMRLRTPSEFAAVYERKHRAGDDHVLLFGLPNELDHPRLGLSVSKKHGNAVRRNRIKRLLREAFRLSQHDLPAGWDFIVIPRQNSGADLKTYRNSLTKTTARLVRKWKS